MGGDGFGVVAKETRKRSLCIPKLAFLNDFLVKCAKFAKKTKQKKNTANKKRKKKKATKHKAERLAAVRF